MKLTPYYYQDEAFTSIQASICNDKDVNPLIVLPTGSGKSLVQALIIEWLLKYPETRILCITHQKELIKQNAIEFMEQTGFMDVGIYSAGLNSRDQFNRVIFAGIQSVFRKPSKLGSFNIVIVDEAHMIPHKQAGMYRTYFNALKEYNSETVFCGMSATPYRLKDGLLTEGEDKLFDKIVFEVSVKELIAGGFLSPVITPKYALKNQVDLSNVHIKGGEYVESELQKAYDIPNIVQQAVKELVENTHDRKKILIFSQGIEHAEHIHNQLILSGQKAGIVHSKIDKSKNDQTLKDFSSGKYKYLVNAKILTTGYNEKTIDCIVLLMSTKSAGLYVQIIGRGTRKHPEKENCLVLDFGSNIKTHGPIDKIEVITNKAGKGEICCAPEKECPVCHVMIAASATECPDCGHLFPREISHETKADNDSQIISEYKPHVQEKVTKVYYTRHPGKNGKPDTVRVTYYNNLMNICSEWLCIEHSGFARKKFEQWFENKNKGFFSANDINDIDHFLDISDSDIKQPSFIYVDYNEKFPKIISYEYIDQEIEELDEIPF